MDILQDAEIIFKRDVTRYEYKFEEDEKCPHDEWLDLYEEIIKKSTIRKLSTIAEESTSIEEKRSDETAITTSSDEVCSAASQESIQSQTHPCLKHVSLSDSQLKFQDIYNFYPIPKDPGIKAGFWILYPEATRYDPDGVDKFFDLAKALGATPIPSVRRMLTSDQVDLKYYVVDTRFVRALCEALLLNETVRTLSLQGSFLSDEACYYLNQLLMRNNVLSSLNLAFCKIGRDGAIRLEEAMSMSSALTELHLSNCELGCEGFKYVAKAVAVNTLLRSLDVSGNDLDEDSAVSMQEMLVLNDSLKRLNLSWNRFNSKVAAEKLFNGLLKNHSIDDVDLSWNSMTKSCVYQLTRYMINSKNIERLNIEANRFSDEEAPSLGRALVHNKCLKELHMGKNPIRSNGMSEFIKYLSSDKFVDSPLVLLNLETYWANKDVLPILDNLKEKKPTLVIKLGGILGNYEIVGPDLKELYFKIANYEAMQPKKKRNKKNFGHFVLSLPDSNITKDNFMELITNSKIKISDNLVKEIMKQFMVTKKSLSQAALKESYMTYFPNTKLPPPPSSKVKKTKTDKKGKKSKSKKGSSKKKGKSKKK